MSPLLTVVLKGAAIETLAFYQWAGNVLLPILTQARLAPEGCSA